MSHASNVLPVLLWAAALIGFVVAMAVAISFFRRRFLAKDGGAPRGRALDDMNSLRATLTPEEYELVRAAAKRRLRTELESEAGEEPPSGNAPGGARAPRADVPPEPGGEGGLVARPGYDLAGDPLPGPGGEGG